MIHKQQEAYKTHNTYLSVAHCPQPDSILTDVPVSGGGGGVATIYGALKAWQAVYNSCNGITPVVKFINKTQH